MLILFEDSLASNFAPVADTRHVAHLLVGTMTLRQRALLATGESQVTLHGRRYIREYYRASGEQVGAPPEQGLFINARFPLSLDLVRRFPTSQEWLLVRGTTILAARLRERSIGRLDWDADVLDFWTLGDIPRTEWEDARPYEYIWDLIADNGERIVADFQESGPAQHGVVMAGAHLVNPAAIRIGEGSVLKPGVVVDASHGPVIIGQDVEVMANAVLQGPCFIGDGALVKIGAKIYGQTSVGPRCKVGGEVENSILLGYSNKQHDGFLGHSYLGRWVNLGADTNTSDLKNNYGTIRVTLGGRQINTGRIFLGALIGDHAKAGINTMLNTGTVIGVGANVFGGGFPDKVIPAFAWGGFAEAERYRIDAAIEAAQKVMARRRVEFTAADDTLLRYLYDRAEQL